LFNGLVITIILILRFPVLSTAQQDTAGASYRINKTYFFSYWHDTKKVVAAPFHWQARQWSVFAGVAGIAAATYFYEMEIYDFAQKNRTETTETAGKYAIEPFGSGLYSIPLLAVIYFSGIKNNHHKNVALTGLKAYLISGGASLVAKHLFHRYRPGENDPPDPFLWDGPYPFRTNHTAFPSGHTTTAFAVASVFANGYRNKTWVGITAYSVATLVGISRIHDGKHWPSDVIAGAALGTFIGTALCKINLKNDNHFSLSPKFTHGINTISLEITFH